MPGFADTSDQSISTEGSRSEMHTTALVVLARIIAKAHLRKTMADRNSVSKTTPPNSQRTSVNDIGNGDSSQL